MSLAVIQMVSQDDVLANLAAARRLLHPRARPQLQQQGCERLAHQGMVIDDQEVHGLVEKGLGSGHLSKL